MTLKLKRAVFSHYQTQRMVNRMYYVTVVAAQIRSCWVSGAAVQVVAALLLLLWPRWKNTGQPSVSCQHFPFSKYIHSWMMEFGIWQTVRIKTENCKQCSPWQVRMKFSFATMYIKQGHTGSKHSLLSAHNTELVGDKHLVCLWSEVNKPTGWLLAGKLSPFLTWYCCSAGCMTLTLGAYLFGTILTLDSFSVTIMLASRSLDEDIPLCEIDGIE